MRARLYTFGIVTAACLCGAGLFAGDEVIRIESGIEVLTLERAIEMALVNNLETKFDRVSIELEQARLRHAWGAFDPVLSINTSRESILRPQNPSDISSAEAARQERAILAQRELARAIEGSGPGIGGGGGGGGSGDGDIDFQSIRFQQENLRSDAGLQGRTPIGTRYGFTLQANRLRNAVLRAGESRIFLPEYETFAGFTLRQPLLRDFGPAANLFEVRVARRNKKIALHTWEQRLQTTVQNVMAIYFDMAYGWQNIQVRQEAIDAGKRLLEENRRRLELGFMAPIDVRQAEVAISTDREELLVARNFFNERQFALKRLILSEGSEADDRVFVPVAAPALDAPRLDRGELMREAFSNRRDYRTAMEEIERENLRLRYARNQMWPQIDLVGTYGFNGLAESYGGSASEAFSGRNPQWSAGVVVSVPLGNIQGRAQLDYAKRLKEQALLRIKQTELTIHVDVNTVMSRIETNLQRVETSRQSRQLEEETVALEMRRLEEGISSTRDVLERRKRLYEARSRELATAAELNKSITQLWLATGTVLQKQAITVEPE